MAQNQWKMKQKTGCKMVLLLLMIQSNDSQISALTSSKELGTSSQKSNDNDAQGNTNSSNSITAALSEGNGDKLRYISECLVQYVPDACPQNKETAVRISGARVLSSDKCVAILKELEEKQKQHQ